MTLEPAIGIAAVVIDDGRLLLGSRIGISGNGCWQLPGGKPQPDDAGPVATVLRELHEETGLVADDATEIARQVDDFPEVGKRYTTLFMGISGARGTVENREPHKNGGWAWFALDALPVPLFLIHPATIAAIRRFARERAFPS